MKQLITVMQTMLAWTLVLGCVLLIAVFSGSRPSVDDAALAVAKRAEFAFQAKVTVAQAVLMNRADPGGKGAKGVELLPGIEAAAGTRPERRLEVAILAGELDGDAAAQERLVALSASHAEAVQRQAAEPPMAMPNGLAAAAADALLLQGWYAGQELSPEDRAGLHTRHGWFADLALARGAMRGDAAQDAAYEPALRAFSFAAVIFGGLACGLIAGLVLGIIVLVRAGTGTWHWRHVPPTPQQELPWLWAFGVYLAGFIGWSLMISSLGLPAMQSIWGFLPVLALLMTLVLRRQGWPAVQAALGLTRGAGILRELGAGLVGYLIGLPLVGIGLLMSNALSRYLGEPNHPIIEDAIAGRWLLMIMTACIFAPVVEELMFRGCLHHHLRARRGPWLAALAGGLIFAAIHPQGLAALPVLTAIGMVFALIRTWRQSILASITAHACHNGLAVTVLMLQMGMS